MVLDGIVDHLQNPSSALQTESSTYEATLRAFFDWCSSADDCALKDTSAESVFTSLLTAAEKSPIPAPYCRVS